MCVSTKKARMVEGRVERQVDLKGCLVRELVQLACGHEAFWELAAQAGCKLEAIIGFQGKLGLDPAELHAKQHCCSLMCLFCLRVLFGLG